MSGATWAIASRISSAAAAPQRPVDTRSTAGLPPVTCAVVAVASGDGLEELLSQLGDTADAQITLSINAEDDAVDLEISAPAAGNGPVIDPSSFSWTILQALSDELDASRDGTVAKVTMRKFRTDQDAA